MSLIFTEGFDFGHTPAGLVTLGKWTASTGGTGGITGRNPGGLAWYSSSSTSNITKRFTLADHHATLIVGFAFYSNINGSYELLSLYGDTGGTQHIALYYDASNGRLQVFRGTTGGTVLGSTPSGLIPGTLAAWYYIELKVTLSDTVGTVDLKLDGVSHISLTNQDTKNAGTGTVFDTATFRGYPSSTATRLDDIYICNGAGAVQNDFLGDVRVEVITPNADGNYSQFEARSANRLPNANVSGIETDASGWAASANCSVDRVTTPVNAGAGALRITSTTAGTVEVITAGQGTGGVPVIAGLTYIAQAYVRSATVTRTPTMLIRWYNAAGSVISTSAGAGGSSSTSNFINAVSVNASAPAYAAYAALLVQFASTAAGGEIHYIDSIIFTEGSAAPTYIDGGSTTHYTTVNDYANIINSAPDSSFVISPTNNQIDTWAHTDLASPSGQAIKGVMQYALARLDVPSAKQIALVARLAGTDATSGDTIPTQTYTMVQKSWETNPSGSPWSVANINSAEFGVKIRPEP